MYITTENWWQNATSFLLNRLKWYNENMKDINSNENIIQIGDTPLSISIYSVKDKPVRMHEPGILEIIFCLSGTVNLEYAYEEFRLRSGEYISVDRDAYYLHSDEDNICASFFIDLKRYKDKYDDIEHLLFVCEGCAQSTTPYPTRYHDRLRGIMIAILIYILDNDMEKNEEQILKSASDIVDLFLNHFDIIFFHSTKAELSEDIIERYRRIYVYLDTHYEDSITLNDISEAIGLSSGYVSEFMRKESIGFRKMLAYIRANKSEWYLMNTDHTIVTISEACGFTDPQYYYKAFKQWYKCTPKQFRKKFIKESQNNITYYDIEHIQTIVDDLMKKHYMDMFL